MRHPETFLAKAKKAWGEPLPDWIKALAEEADRIKLKGIAIRLEYSQAAISSVLSKKYGGDVGRIEGKVHGLLLGATVVCPVYGEIGRDQCLDLQRKQHPTSEAAGRCYRSCRGLGVPKCPNSRIPDGGAR
ncbi:transcriptional regulator [Bradyrhizobium sp. BR 10289]|uniref:transcriptional regulator n=1 Tax=Bradyrhizobium sp. BR 10289 TaxID=2749993 RepID=UPI001C6514D8|nr:transcriptional regulator [Bradyrhizobium sp. BR 10289]MBW7968148.1 transcriptional regulator [Bradyrhizobium sp. BR 10289]